MAIRILASTDSNENYLKSQDLFYSMCGTKRMGFKLHSTLNSSMVSVGFLTYSSFSQTFFYYLQNSFLKKSYNSYLE